MKLVASVCAALWLVVGQPARAAPVGVVVVAPAEAPVLAGDARAAVADAARAAGASVELAVFDRARAILGRGAVHAERLGVFASVRERVRQGWRAYLGADIELSRERLLEAQREAEAVLDLDGGLMLYADIALRLGAVLLQLGHAEDAARAVALARRLDPAREVSLAQFAPDVVEAWDEADSAAGAAVVEVVATPREARIELDGRDLGTTPLSLQTTPGRHVLLARAPGYRSRALILDLLPQPAGPVHVALDPDPAASALLRGPDSLAPGTPAAEATAALEALVRHGELRAIVVVASLWRRGSPALVGQRCGGVPIACTAIVEIGYAHARPVETAQAASALWAELAARPYTRAATLLADARLARPEARPAPLAGAEERCRGCGQRWLWIGGGAAVAALATGAIWMLLRDPDIRPVITLDPCDFGGCR